MLGLGLGIKAAPNVVAAASFANNKSLLFREGPQGDFVTSNYTTSTVWQGSHSISCWAKPRDGRPLNAEMFWSVADGTSDAFALQLGSTGVLSYSLISNSDLMVFASAAARFADGAQSDFKHYVAVITKVASGNSTFVLYENGSAISVNQLGGGSLELTEANHAQFGAGVGDHAAFAIGGKLASAGSTISPYEGHMDEVTVWNTALDANAASEIYNGGDPTDLTSDGTHYSASNVVLYYRFEDDATDTAETSDATITGATFSTTVPSS
tara:strand:- start:1319 stop:2122 length:804 start_codon:yes stop_codon:yes gene_type:complete